MLSGMPLAAWPDREVVVALDINYGVRPIMFGVGVGPSRSISWAMLTEFFSI